MTEKLINPRTIRIGNLKNKLINTFQCSVQDHGEQHSFNQYKAIINEYKEESDTITVIHGWFLYHFIFKIHMQINAHTHYLKHL